VLPKLLDLLKSKKAPSQVHSTPAPTTPDSAMSAPHPASCDELFQQAQSLHQQGQLEGAIELYGQRSQVPDTDL
jgi:hypothetical protein